MNLETTVATTKPTTPAPATDYVLPKPATPIYSGVQLVETQAFKGGTSIKYWM